MLHIKSLDDGLEVFKALGSEVRVNIVKLLLENREMNMNELASSLGITNGALTSHIKKLEETGIIKVITEHGGHEIRSYAGWVWIKFWLMLKPKKQKAKIIFIIRK